MLDHGVILPGGLVVLGSGSIPLARAADLRRFVEVAAGPAGHALANNRYSADVVAISRAADLAGLPPLPADNALPRWLEERAGVAVGLAWTPVGGDVLFIEAGRMPGGSKGLIMTGQLGPVMQESVQAALTWVRGNAASLGIDPELFKTIDIHIHVPSC